MFSNLGTYFDEESRLAEKFIIKNDRMQYDEIYNKIKDHMINDETSIFSDTRVIMTSKKLKFDLAPDLNYVMVIYSTHPRRTTTKITNFIHESYGKFVHMQSVIPNKEYSIFYNMRPILRLYKITRYKNINLINLFDATLIKKIPYFPASIELIGMYHKLYLPNFYDDWVRLQSESDYLYKIFEKTNVKIDNVKIKQSCSSCKETRQTVTALIRKLMLDYIANENFVLVGEAAHSIYSPGKNNVNSIQVISENLIETDYQNISSYLSKFTKFGIFFKKRKMYVPQNDRMHKYTLYIKFPSVKSFIDKPFMDIYDCGTYELIPYFVKSKYKIAISYTQLYFLFIDYWLTQLVHNVKGIDSCDFNKRMIRLRDLITKARKLPKYTNKYIGTNYDEKIEKKLAASQSAIQKSSYYPEVSIKDTKKYKVEATSSW